MGLGEKLYDLRREKHLSQEEVAEKLNVTRQTVSKWETNQSTPDFDKIAPLCALYGISADELLTGVKKEESERVEGPERVELQNQRKKGIGIGIGILIYFIAIAWIMISIPVMQLNPIVSSAVFLLICGVATFVIVYAAIVYKEKKKLVIESKQDKLKKQVIEIASIITVFIYLFISFFTMAWHITWLIWIVYALVEEIIKLIFLLRGNGDEK
jgi:transcriptional regulator with XRE-family HTH domain